MGLVLFCSGYNNTEAFNDRRLVDLARLVPFGPSGSENASQEDSSLTLLNAALCLPDTTVAADDSASVAAVSPSNNESTLVDLKLGVSVPVTLAAGLPLTKTATEAEPELPKLETPVDQRQDNLPPGVTPEALHALERLLGKLDFKFCSVVCIYDHSYIWFDRKINCARYFDIILHSFSALLPFFSTTVSARRATNMRTVFSFCF